MSNIFESWEEKRRKSRNRTELRFLNEMKALELKARMVEMENQLNTMVSRAESKISNIETRMNILERRKKKSECGTSLDANLETAIVQEIKEIVRAYPHAHDKQPLDSKLTSLTVELGKIDKKCQSCKNMCHKQALESD